MTQELQHGQDTRAGTAEDGALFPAGVRRVMLGVVVAVTLAGVYLISVRGTAILFDLADGIAALCF